MRRTFMAFLFLVVLSFSLTACLSTVNLAEGISSFKLQNYRQAFVRLLPEAKKGNPDAQYAIGYMYYYGQGVTEDREKALKWIRLAAVANQPDALIALQAIRKEPKIVPDNH